MDKRIQNNWIKNLTSGEYDQTDGKLCHVNIEGQHSFCCLGVLCNMHAVAHGNGWKGEASGGPSSLSYGRGKYSDSMPSKTVLEWAGLDKDFADELANMNDDGDSFKKIAKAIAKKG
jgi:hypothetical protein